MLHLFNIYHENKDSDNCAQVLEEECIRMFGTKYLNDENDCNVVSMGVFGTQETFCYLVAGLFERDHLHPTPPTD